MTDDFTGPLPLLQKQNVDASILESSIKQHALIEQDMAKKLDAFTRIAKKAASNIAHSAVNDRTLREALYTRQNPQPNYITEDYNNYNNYNTPQPVQQPVASMQIGSFAVFAMPNANNKTRYDIANQATGQQLIAGMHLAEAANAIVKMLNNGHSFYSPQIRQILAFEDSYSKQYNDAVSFSRKAKNSPTKDMILETRFAEAKNKALTIKQELTEYLRKI